MNHTTDQDQNVALAAPTGKGPFVRWNAVASFLDRIVSHAMLSLACRLSIAAIFFYSGRTKVGDGLKVTESAVELFASEYKVPLLSPEFAAQMAAYAEHLFPLLLVLGLFTRLSALALLGMTLVIQVFVYPDAWPTHLSWAAILLYLTGRGAGPLSLDRVLGIR
jgi:putative oxidoreductase